MAASQGPSRWRKLGWSAHQDCHPGDRKLLRFSENQHHYCLGSLQPFTGTRISRTAYTSSEFLQLVLSGHPGLALNSQCDCLAIQLPYFPCISAVKNLMQNEHMELWPKEKAASFFDCPASFKLENGYLDDSKYWGVGLVHCDPGLRQKREKLGQNGCEAHKIHECESFDKNGTVNKRKQERPNPICPLCLVVVFATQE